MASPLAPRRAAERLVALLRREHDDRLIERALRAGLVSPEQAAEARRLRDDNPEDPLPGAILVERGWVGAAALADLAEAEARDEFARPATVQTGPTPPEVERAASDPDRILGGFVLLALLGRGGEGEVWKAWDARLARHVAIKISTTPLESAAARQRFERQALAAARLAHPNIVPVFQAGFERGRSFLVMPYIEGETLDRASLSVLRAVEVMRTVASAVEHAHRQGVVHRDLKPGNIMLDNVGGVFVLDFGLAFLREDSASRLTLPGQVLGTASYLAPEQARGEGPAADATVDVYGLGASLYRSVTGRAPFAGESMAVVIGRVMAEDPARPRRVRPGLDPRVEAVIVKAMDRDPGRRYGTAAAFAEDLQRILENREIKARPAGVFSRLRRLSARKPAWFVFSAGLVTAVLAWSAGRWRTDRERRGVVDAFGHMARLSLDSALRLRRSGDTASMQKVMPDLIAAYGRVQKRVAPSAEVEYLMGRTYRALFQEDKALDHQERALAKDGAFAPALYERAVLLSQRYGRRVDGIVWGRQAQLWPSSRRESEAERLRPDLKPLREQVLLNNSRLQSLPLGGAQADAARGMLAYHRGESTEACALLARAVAAEPHLEEAWETLARARAAAGQRREAEATYKRAIEIDRGYVPHFVGLCNLLVVDDPAAALAAAERAIALDSGSSAAHLCRGNILIARGREEGLAGGNSVEALDVAKQDFDLVVRQYESAHNLWLRSGAETQRAIVFARRGRDPLPDLAAAEADLTRAIALAGGRANYWSARSRVRIERARHLIDTGHDPDAAFLSAQADLREAHRLDPKHGHFRPLAILHSTLGLHALLRGRQAEAHFREAERAFEQASAQADNAASIILPWATMRIWHGQALALRGEDPLPVWAAAESQLGVAVKTFPKNTGPVVQRGLLGLERGLFLSRRWRGAAAADLVAATKDIDWALNAEPEHMEALIARARLRHAVGNQAGARKDIERIRALQPERASNLDLLPGL